MNIRTNNGRNSSETRRRRRQTTPTATSEGHGAGFEVRSLDFERKPRCLAATNWGPRIGGNLVSSGHEFGEFGVGMNICKSVTVYTLVSLLPWLLLSCNSNGTERLGNKLNNINQSSVEKQTSKADETLVTILCQIDVFIPAAVDSLGDSPESSISIPGTQIKIIGPNQYEGKTFYIHHSSAAEEVMEEWKAKGQKLRFEIDRTVLEGQLRSDETLIYTVQLRNLQWL